MTEAERPRPTFDDLYRQIEALPEGVTGQVLEAGVLTTMSRPGVRHELALRGLDDALAGSDVRRGGQGWWILREMEVRLGDRLAVPDLLGFRVERVPALPQDNPMGIVPDFCGEVLSPTTMRQDRMRKLPLYVASGVRWTWLIDPEVRTVEVFETIDGRAVRVAGAEEKDVVRLPPFEQDLPLARWWSS